MTFKQKYQEARQAVLAYFGWDELPLEGKALKLSEDDRNKFKEAFSEGFLKTFETATAAHIADEEKASEEAKSDLKVKMKALQAEIEQLNQASAEKDRQIEQLADAPEVVAKENVIIPGAKKDAALIAAHSDKSTHLFNATGHDFMAISEERSWNLRAHAAILAEKGISLAIPEASIDYSQLANDFDKYWKLVRSEIKTLPYIKSQFDGLIDKISGISDKAVGFNLFLDELTQAYQADFVAKGAFSFQPETQEVKDVEIAYEFKNLKQLERNWIGMITGAANDSSPIKLSFVAFLAQHMVKKMIMEIDQRTASGRYKAPVNGVAGAAINAADGLYSVLNAKIAEFKIRVTTLGLITDANIDQKVVQLVETVPQIFRDALQLVLWVPSGYLRKYNDALNSRYGASRPNRSDIAYVDGYPNVQIKEIPYSTGRMRMFITMPGNMARLENKPMEAFNGMRMVTKIKSIEANSVWKEGFMFHLAGRKAASAAQVAARDYMEQAIWCNEIDFDPNYFVQMEKDDATPSVKDHSSLISVANTSPVAITNFDDAVTGQEIRIKCGVSGDITIAASGNFSLLSAAWAPNAGDILVLKKRSDGKFIELQRIDAATAGAVVLAADATAADADLGEFFITSANSGATAITTISNAVSGVVYKIQGGSSTNATTIANSGNFVLTANITLSAGVWIEVEKSASDSKFYEIRRSA